MLAMVGLVPGDELIVWFTWVHSQVSVLGGDPIATEAPQHLHVVNAAITAYRRRRELVQSESESDPSSARFYEMGAAEGWLQLEADNYGYAVDCSGKDASPPRLRMINEYFVEDDTETMFRAVSLCTIVTWWLEELESGALTWDSSASRWSRKYGQGPALKLVARFW